METHLQITMETHLPNKFLHAHRKSHVTLRYETG